MNQIEQTQANDTTLLFQIKESNKQSFDLLFKKYWDSAYADAYKRIKKTEPAKDIVQDIFTHIWINRETLEIHDFPAYLHVAVRHKVIKYVTTQKKHHFLFNYLDNLSEKNFEADSTVLWKEFIHSYEELLDSLPPQRQLIFRLRYQEDLPTKIISMQLGITRKTVQNQLGKAIATLKGSLLRVFFTFLLMVFALSL